jgi:hypothetical protein
MPPALNASNATSADTPEERAARARADSAQEDGGESEMIANPNYSNFASDWKPPRKAMHVIPSKHPRCKSSVTALKTFNNTSNLKANWFGKELKGDRGDRFWVPSKKAIDSSDMRMLASKEFPASATEYRDADVFACGALPSQYAPPKLDALHQLHPPDLVDSLHPKSLVQTAKVMNKTLPSGGKEVASWDGTVRDVVSAKLWRLRESVK